MLVIRLARTGRKKYPTYRIVAAESARPTTGKFVAILGHYNPHTKELVIKKEDVQTYISHGAQPSNTVIKLLQQEKVELPVWVKLKTKAKAPKKPAEESAAAPSPAAEASPSAPAEEAKPDEVEAAAGDSVAETAAEQSEAVEDAKLNQADDSDEGPMPTAATEEAQAEAAEKAEDTAAQVALDAAKEDAEKPAKEA